VGLLEDGRWESIVILEVRSVGRDGLEEVLKLVLVAQQLRDKSVFIIRGGELFLEL